MYKEPLSSTHFDAWLASVLYLCLGNAETSPFEEGGKLQMTYKSQWVSSQPSSVDYCPPGTGAEVRMPHLCYMCHMHILAGRLTGCSVSVSEVSMQLSKSLQEKKSKSLTTTRAFNTINYNRNNPYKCRRQLFKNLLLKMSSIYLLVYWERKQFSCNEFQAQTCSAQKSEWQNIGI